MVGMTYAKKFQMMMKTYLWKFKMRVLDIWKLSNDANNILKKLSDDGYDIFEKVSDDAKDILEKVSNYGGFNPNFDLNTNFI